MEVRDQHLLREVTARPFGGYARHDGVVLHPAADRLLACVALLATMVLSGILLGSPARDR